MRSTAIAKWQQASSRKAAIIVCRSRATRTHCSLTRARVWPRPVRARRRRKPRNKGRGRIETRVGIVVAAKGLAKHHEFQGLKAFGRIEATREIDGKIETDVRIFALSRQLPVEQFMSVARAHWEIENKLHWVLDVAMREDDARNRKDNGPANIAVLRRRAMDVARRDKSKGSISTKLKRAGWNDDFMIELLSHMR